MIGLQPDSTVETSIPGFGFWGAAKCDDHGNLYFHAATTLNDTALLRLDANGSSQNFYTLPTSTAQDVVFTAFQIDRDDRLWLLTQERTTRQFSLFGFRADATQAPSRVHLDTPAGLSIQNFVMLPREHVLLVGYFNDKADSKSRGHRYTAEFDQAGRLMHELSLKSDDVNLEEVARQFGQGGAVTVGDDGLIYLLHAKEIIVLSSTGNVKSRLVLEKPADDYLATNISVSGGQIIVRLTKKDDHQFVILYLLINAVTSRPVAYYMPTDETGNNLVCFSASRGFTFYRVQNGRVRLVTAKP